MKKGKWFYYWKKVQGRITSDTYVFIAEEDLPSTEEAHLEIALDWAEKVDSCGSNNGFEYGFDDIESPPKEWLEKRIKYQEGNIQSKLAYIEFLKIVLNKN